MPGTLEKNCYRGVPINDFTDSEAFQASVNLIQSGTRPHQIVTLGPASYIEARTNPDFLQVLHESSLVVPESTGLKLYSLMFPPSFGRIMGGRFLAVDLVDYCAKQGKRVALFGTSSQSREAARKSFLTKNNNADIHVIPGDYDFANPTDSQYVAQALDTLSPDFAVMAGIEVRAERWINQWLIRNGVDVGLVGNFGQTLDCEAGQRVHFSRPISKLGISWLLRIPTMTPERREQYLKVLGNLVSLSFNDLNPVVKRRVSA